MKNNKNIGIIFAGALLMLIGIVAAGCASSASTPTAAPVATTAPTSAPAPELSGDPVRGGVLYDAWWEVIGADKPTTDQPL
ncbi:MAG: hypothetical protein AAB217_08925 [Chloroflexota bacterium]